MYSRSVMGLGTSCGVFEYGRRKQEGFVCLLSEMVFFNPSRVRGNMTINKTRIYKRISIVVVQERLLVDNFVYGEGSE
jgi:hypothetical protein